MKKLIKILAIIIAGLLLIGALFIGLGIFLGGTLFYKFNFNNVNFEQVEYYDGSEKLDDFSKMDIDLSSADVYILPGEENKIEYHLRKDNEPEINVENETLYVQEKNENHLQIGLQFDLDNEYYRIYVTEDQIADIDMTSGSLSIDQVNVDGTLSVSSGEISVKGSKGEKLELSSTSGSIEVRDCEYEDFKTNQTSGDLDLNNVNSKTINCKAFSGGQSIDTVECETLNTEVSSGECRIYNIKADKVEVKDKSGSIKLSGCEISDLVAEATSGEFIADEAVISNVKVDVTSGSVRLDLSGDISEYNIDAKVTSGDVEINGDDKDGAYKQTGSTSKTVNVETTSGEIEVNIQ